MIRCVAVMIVGLAVAGWGDRAWSQETKPCMKLGAYYFAGWAGKSTMDDGKAGHAWAQGMPSGFSQKLATEFSGRMPLWGWRDDTQEVMERQIDLAADHGIAYFSFCWYWYENKRPINLKAIEDDPKHLAMRLFMQAKNNRRMEFCLLVANHAGHEIVGLDAWRQAADYWLTLFKHPRYLRVEGKPLLVIFSPRGTDPQGLAYLQEAARKAGFPGVAVAGCANPKPEDGFGFKTRYTVNPGYGKGSARHAYQELVEAHVKTWFGMPRQPCIPAVSVGFDRRPWEGPGGWGLKGVVPSWYFEGKTPEAFTDFLTRLVRWMDAHPEQVTKDRLAVVYAWNEIGEGGSLVPCKEDPEGAYLKAIRRVVLGK